MYLRVFALAAALCVVAVAAAPLRIVTYPNNSRVWKSRIATQYNGVEIFDDHEDFVMGTTNREDWFMAVNPFHKVPTLFTEDASDGVFESNAILRYVARLGADTHDLYASDDPLKQSRIDAFLDMELSIKNAMRPWIGTTRGWLSASDEEVKNSMEGTKVWLVGVERQLMRTPYLVGDSVTLADISLVTSLYAPFETMFSAGYVTDIPLVVDYFKRVVALPEFAAVIPETAWLMDQASTAKEEL